MQLNWEHWAGLSVSLLIVVFLGIMASRKVKNAADFALAGQSSGATMVAGTIIGTIIGLIMLGMYLPIFNMGAMIQ